MIVSLQTLVFFRESLFTILQRFLRPYYKSLTFNQQLDESDDDSDEQVFSEYDDEKGVVFYPHMYIQRYAAVSDCLMDERWCGQLQKVVDFGYNDMSFLEYLKDVPGVQTVLGVDLQSIPLRYCTSLQNTSNIPKTENPLKVTLFQGNAADPDYRLIGCDAVIAIEMIEHMLPHDLDRFVHTVFGFIQPRVVVITTPNADFNVLFKSLEINGLRRLDHYFEWTREQFHDWCSNIIVRYENYTVTSKGIGPGPPGTSHLGCCSQLALFVAKNYHKQQDLNVDCLAFVESAPNMGDEISSATSEILMDGNYSPCKLNCSTLEVKKFSKFTQNLIAKNKTELAHTLWHNREVMEEISHLKSLLNFNKNQNKLEVSNSQIWNNINWGDNAPYWNQYYKVVKEYSYPYENKSTESRILEVISDEIHKLVDLQLNKEYAKKDNRVRIPLEHLLRVVSHITDDKELVREVLEWNGYEIINDMVIYSRSVIENDFDIVQEGDWDDTKETTDVKAHF